MERMYVQACTCWGVVLLFYRVFSPSVIFLNSDDLLIRIQTQCECNVWLVVHLIGLSRAGLEK